MTSERTKEQVREALTPYLEPGEDLRAVGHFQSGGNWLELPKRTFFTVRYWFVGVSDRRVILVKQARLSGKVLEGGVFTVPRESVAVKWGRQLRIKSPDRKVPKWLTAIVFEGYHKDEFAKALES